MQIGAIKLKTIGLIGGMSWTSSLEYYRIINELTAKELGGLHSAKILLYSIDFEELNFLQRNNQWIAATDLITKAICRLEQSGSDIALICSNTGHEGADIIAKKVKIPLLHIVDVTAREITSMNLNKVGLIGTKYTMEKKFFKDRLKNNFGINVIIPEKNDREIIHNVIYKELCNGLIRESSKKQFLRIINSLVEAGAGGIVLGCTEIPLLIGQKDAPIPVFDTTRIHAKAAVDFALASS